MSGAWLYILRCGDGSFYVGTTRATLEQRLSEHQAGRFGGYTAARRPVELVFSEHFMRIEDAIAAERRVKGWRRSKKLALIEGRLADLPALSKRSPQADALGPSFETPPAAAPQDEDNDSSKGLSPRSASTR